MSAPTGQSYRFATPAQWGAGVLSGAVADAGGVQPYPAHGWQALSFAGAAEASLPVWAAACAHDGSAWWRGATGMLYCLETGSVAPTAIPVADGLAVAGRLVPGRRVVWAAHAGRRTLWCHERASLGLMRCVAIGATVIDIAGDGRDGLWVLAGRLGAYWLLHVDHGGRLRGPRRRLPPAMRAPQALVCLHAARLCVLLAGQGTQLWFVGTDGLQRRPPLALAAVHAGFGAHCLGSDGHDLLVLGGRDFGPGGGRARVLLADIHGTLLDQVEPAAPVTAVSAHRGLLLVTTTAGPACYTAAAGTGAASVAFLTPPLHAPATTGVHGWLRADLAIHLPRGALLSVEWVATDDAERRAAALQIGADPHLPPQVRQDKLDRLLGPWSTPVLYAGSADGAQPQTLSAPLLQARAAWLWLRVRLTMPTGAAAPGLAPPRLAELRVWRPDLSLMAQLPAIFRRDDDPDDFLRALLGVIETTTQDLDRKTAAIGSLLHPESADAAWLDQTARWLGLPWDDALDLAAKRRLLRAGPAILARRGTRAGLARLLESLFPQGPGPRWRIRDFSADAVPVTLGGRGAAGAALPALLAGLSGTCAAVGRRKRIGQVRLAPRDTAASSVMPWAGLVRIEIDATAQQRASLARSLPALIDALMPATARLQLRWREHAPAVLLADSPALARTGRSRLGRDAILGDTRLPAHRPVDLSEAGIAPGFGLQ